MESTLTEVEYGFLLPLVEEGVLRLGINKKPAEKHTTPVKVQNAPAGKIST